MTANPVVLSVDELDVPIDEMDKRERQYQIEENLKAGQERINKFLPVRYTDAVVTEPAVREWVRELIVGSTKGNVRMTPHLSTGPSLLLLGPTGTGKTYQAYGAVRALSLSGLVCRWQFATAADIYARLRPRHKVDSEEEFRTIANASLLVIDDLGAAKTSEWTEEINYRLINHRYERELATLITSNVSVADLKNAIGDRVTSRLAEMTRRVVLKGDDRRRTRKTNNEGEAA